MGSNDDRLHQNSKLELSRIARLRRMGAGRKERKGKEVSSDAQTPLAYCLLFNEM